MLRTLYAIIIMTLIIGTTWTAANATSTNRTPNAGIGLVILVALQR